MPFRSIVICVKLISIRHLDFLQYTLCIYISVSLYVHYILSYVALLHLKAYIAIGQHCIKGCEDRFNRFLCLYNSIDSTKSSTLCKSATLW